MVELGLNLHLEKKLRCPLDEVSPSYESLCLRLSEGPPWPLLGAEMSMLLLLSLLLELRPRPETCISPEPSWERREKEQLVMKAPVTTLAASGRRIMWGELMMCFPRWTVKCGREKMFQWKSESISCEQIWLVKMSWGMLGIETFNRGKSTSCFS